MSELEKKLEVELSRCNKCGLCMAGCPVYKATGIEYDTARGRVDLIQSAMKGQLDMAKDIREAIDTCILCRGCTVYCPGQVNIDEIVRLARAIRQEKKPLPLAYRVAFSSILPNSRFMEVLTQALRMMQKIGVGRKYGLGGLIPFVAKQGEIVPDISKRSARSSLKREYKAIGKKRGNVAYFLGCVINILYPEVARATIGILTLNGWDVVVPDANCCGLPAGAEGDTDNMIRMVKKNVEVLSRLQVEAIVTDCASCASTIAAYQGYLKDDPLFAEARDVSAKVSELSQFLVKTDFIKPTNEVGKRATYHHPCHLGRYLNTAPEVPKQLIKSIPGIRFVDSAKETDCCGGAGSYCVTQVERSQLILADKMRAFIDSGADTIITCCPSCMMQLQYGVKLSKKKLQVLHLSELLAKGYGLEIS
jgi:glycolate oxidase iron-sulfur subunit